MDGRASKPAWMTEEHRLFEESTKAFLGSELVPNIERWRSQGLVDRAFWNKAGDAGLLGATIPDAHGGSGAPYSFDAITMYEQALAGDPGWGFAIQSIVSHYVQTFGTDRQKARWLPKMATGEFVTALAMTEPGTGSDVQSITTYATEDGDDYLVDGAKTFITNGQLANLVCVAVKTNRDVPGSRGVSLVMVETDGAPGFKRGRNLAKVGMKGADTSELFFESVRVPKANLLGEVPGQGFMQLMMQLPWERLLIGIGALGACDAALRATLAYTQERKAFGRRIYDFQNTRFKLAECATKIEVTRSFINDCIARADNNELDVATASMAKYWGSEIQGQVLDECLQLFGGYGYMLEYPIANWYADARVQRIYGGTTEIMKELIARSMDG